MNDQQIEAEIQAKGLTAPRVTLSDIESRIVSEVYFTAEDGIVNASGLPRDHIRLNQPALRLLTLCVLVLRNGFTVTGESACASPENYDAETGRKIARKNAIDKVWPLEGYLLKERLYWAAVTGKLPATVPPAPVQLEAAVPVEAAICPRASENGDLSMFQPPFNGEMVWREDHTCSYCGSLDPALVMARLEAGDVFLATTDKNYKAYLRNDGGENLASPSGKFYFQHLSAEQQMRFVDLVNAKKIKFASDLGFSVLPYFMISAGQVAQQPV